MAKLKELRCQGNNNKGKTCGQLLYRYEFKNDEFIIEIKCSNCNTFTVLRLPFDKKNNQQNKSLNNN